MWKLIKWVVAILILGGIVYYILGYDDKNPEKSDLKESIKDFGNDAAGVIKEGVETIKDKSEEDN